MQSTCDECGHTPIPPPVAGNTLRVETVKPLRLRRNSTLPRRLTLWFSADKALKELKDPLFWHDVIMQTLVCVFYSCSIIWIGITLNKNAYQPGVTHFGLYAGFFVFILLEGWCPLGAAINVAGTLAFFICGRMSPIKSLIFFVVEIGGCSAGAVLAKVLTPEKHHDLFYPLVPGDGVTDFMAMCIEGILTANLIIVALVVTDPKLKANGPMKHFAIGFCISTGILAAGTHTGGLQNPMIPMIFAIVSNNFDHHWPYWVGPLLGSAIATVFYMLMEKLRERYGPYHEVKEEPKIGDIHGIDGTHNDAMSLHCYIEESHGTGGRELKQRLHAPNYADHHDDEHHDEVHH